MLQKALGSLIILFLSYVFSMPPVSAAELEVVRPHGNEFIYQGQAYRFVGANLRGICHYGGGDILPYTQIGHQDENLNALQAMGGKVLRVFAACRHISHQETADRLEVVLDKAHARGLKVIVCFTDLYPSGFNPQGDDGYYQLQPNGWTVLDNSWFADGYRNHYLPLVQLVVEQLKEHPGVFAWQLGNELTNLKNPAGIMTFTADMAAAIKAIDPLHMVTTGYLSVDHIQLGESLGYLLYADPNIDFITVHTYNGEDPSVNRAIHSRLGKPLVVEEYGWNQASGNRVTNTSAQVAHWFSARGARGFMPWGFQAQSYDIGDGDNIVGMDSYAHSDYQQLFEIYRLKAEEIRQNPLVLPEHLEPRGINIAPTAVDWRADSVFSPNYGGDKAIDGIISAGSKWTSAGTPPPHWLALDLGHERQINGVTLRLAGAAQENVGYNFRSFQIQTANSLEGDWTTQYTGQNTAQFSFYHCLFDPPLTTRYLRLFVTDTGVDAYARLPEIEVYEEPGFGAWQTH